MKAFILFILFSASVMASIQKFSGINTVTGVNTNVVLDHKKSGTVVVFLSALCPCSDSHISYLKGLKEKFPLFDFIGIHSNADEEVKITKEYFTKANLNFPIISDPKSLYANELGASRTPHSYLISNNGEILYQGGVTNSSKADKASEFYLFDALNSYQNGKKIKVTNSRVLGCEISRN
jgi:hypothetical protein